ncbi:hypothetical protein SAMN00777080_1333 [Aquiflexum balticum DSM 16537]|uniref:Uncharacterized protein n=1 Tax=Aquiflexum balticum DSM 16537 TaxID=758820 RepID=A0A1W2H2C5_9BACT|nr:hypothetical protein SAMN00777080_1333 [Aquiflexum balticum DSM 16537]
MDELGRKTWISSPISGFIFRRRYFGREGDSVRSEIYDRILDNSSDYFLNPIIMILALATVWLDLLNFLLTF